MDFHDLVATLSEIAVKAGVSEATASRVLNDKPGVSPTARQAVLSAMDVLGYERPARLRRRSSGLVGLVIPELENPIFPAFAQLIANALAARRFTPVLCALTAGGLSEDDYVSSLLDHGIAGAIFVAGQHADAMADHSRYHSLVDSGLPVVFINGYVDDLKAPFVSADDRASVGLALDHLIELGHRRVGMAAGPMRLVGESRKREAFVEGCSRQLDLSAEEAESWIEEARFTIEGGAAATRRLLSRGATALICASDLMALGAIRAAREAGLRVPDDVSVIGYDDSSLLEYVDPPLTTVRQPVQGMATAAVGFLIDAIEGQPVPRHEYVFRPELVLRSSTARAH